MKKLILISALSICNITTPMDGNEKIQLGSAEEIKQALNTKNPRFVPLTQHKRILSLANRVTTPNSVEHIVFWVNVDDLRDTLHRRDIEDATAAIVTTGKKPVPSPKPHPINAPTSMPSAKL